MKKLLSLFLTICASSVFVTQIASCNKRPSAVFGDDNPLKIGLEIDRKNAIKDKDIDQNSYGVTNYYILGDSLSDVDGLTTYMGTKLSISNLKINFKFDGDFSWNFDNVDEFSKLKPTTFQNKIIKKAGEEESDNEDNNDTPNNEGTSTDLRSSFSNGPTASFLLGRRMFNVKDMKPSNIMMKKPTYKGEYGTTYAVGGATASHTGSSMSTLLEDAAIDNQAKALISQHKFGSKAVVAMSIGGNDVFNMISTYNPYGASEKTTQIMDEAIEKIRYTVFSLLNNGIKNILLITSPSMDKVPKNASRFYKTYDPNSEDENKSKCYDAYGKLYDDPNYEGSICYSNGDSEESEDEDNPITAGIPIRKKTNETIFIEATTKEFNRRIENIVKEVHSYYPNGLRTFDLFNKFDSINEQSKFTIKYENYINNVGLAVWAEGNPKPDYDPIGSFSLNSDTLKKIVSKIAEAAKDVNSSSSTNRQINVQLNFWGDPRPGYPADVNSYFFDDNIHPTKIVHSDVEQMLEKEIKELFDKNKNEGIGDSK
ncbi:SGNH/GDSL hydrolase family protein [Spiroplasma tabanidicola]|uniref:Lysophospholipase n=1 Tax=Spiroplasma tabanidicola TaxID=324079 RepID=A0A6I6CAA4_9MOLU|nr:SGNH/GDSL hydrolase family protein [Spiroplasma tabanidicola]QGS51875.1 lysophospholipase [Spiroplasma tabanidicola]